MTDKSLGKLRLMTETDLPLVLSWRNHPSIRRHMYTQNVITQEEHLAWWEAAKTSSKSQLYIYERGETPSGYVAFTQIAPQSATAPEMRDVPDDMPDFGAANPIFVDRESLHSDSKTLKRIWFEALPYLSHRAENELARNMDRAEGADLHARDAADALQAKTERLRAKRLERDADQKIQKKPPAG